MKKGNNFENAVRISNSLFWKDKRVSSCCLKWLCKSIEHNLNKLLEAVMKLVVNYQSLIAAIFLLQAVPNNILKLIF